MTSSSGAGNSNITLTFDLDRNIDSAVVDVQTAIAAAMPLLPSTLTSPPSFRKQNPADQPILMLNLTSSTMAMSAVDDYAENVLAPRISMVDGVSQVSVQGAQKYAVRVQVDPNKLQAQKIGLNEVDQALQNWNVNQPTGQLFGPQSTYTINANGLLQSPNGLLSSARGVPADRRSTYRQGRPVRLDQVANVLDSVETTTQRAWLYTKHGRAARHHAAGAEAAGHQRHRGHRRVRAVLPDARGAAAAVGAPERPPGSLEDHPPGVQRHPDHDARHARAGRRRHLPLPAQRRRRRSFRRSRCPSRSSARSP